MPGCGYIPTDMERIDWFLPSVAEATYAAAKAHCQAKKLTEGLNYPDMIKLYNHTCFAKYPHFQLAELQNSNLSQNSNRIGGKTGCIYHPNANHTTAECDKAKVMNKERSKEKGKGKPNKSKYGNRSFNPKAKGKGKGKSKGGKGKGRGTGTPFDGLCRECGKSGHMARDCYSRTKTGTQTFQQNQQPTTTPDEATLKFSPFAVHATTNRIPTGEMYTDDTSEENDKEESDTDGDEDHAESPELDIDFQQEDGDTTSEAVNESSDINNDERTERLRLFQTWGGETYYGNKP